MTHKQIDMLFDPFTQGDSSTMRRYGGTGPGMIITKQFFEMMGGSVSVESKEGSGTTITLQIPARVEKH